MIIEGYVQRQEFVNVSDYDIINAALMIITKLDSKFTSLYDYIDSDEYWQIYEYTCPQTHENMYIRGNKATSEEIESYSHINWLRGFLKQ